MQAAILAWYETFGRDLPWRRTRDPYAILVSEVMLQQTQVSRVLPRYAAWLDRWPTVETLANASTADVLREWQGLGYNRRAVNLQRTARAVRELGGFPREVAALELLPGIGPYTARALACFAFGAQVATPDVNARRVLERATGSATAAPPAGDAYAWNQALFDLGALVCLARIPRCDSCPLAAQCPSRGKRFAAARRHGAFEGSVRQMRARVVRELTAGSRPGADYDPAVVAGLLRDGLVVTTGAGLLALPEENRP